MIICALREGNKLESDIFKNIRGIANGEPKRSFYANKLWYKRTKRQARGKRGPKQNIYFFENVMLL